ncbi:MAG: hypothetical protein U9N59_15900 [Campylobacterota bacterium]|nr:hypothetical protein [Campylobacterota bacterium]
MGFFESILTYIKNIMFIELLKRLLFEKFFKKLFAFIAAVTIIPLAIYILELDKEPKWTKNKIYYVDTTLTVSVNTNKKDNNSLASEDLKANAIKLIKTEIYNKALNQIKISHEWDTLENSTKEKIEEFLKKEITHIKLLNIKKQDIYTKDNTIYALYSLRDEYILVHLQKIYSKLNNIMIKE